MHRCYILRQGRIVKAEYLDAATLDDVIVAARELLSAQAPSRGFDGIEIWRGASLLYSDNGSCAGGTRNHGRSDRDEAGFVHDALDQPATEWQR